MSNVSGIIAQEQLREKIIQYVGEEIFDIHYAESDNTEVKTPRTDKKYQYVIKYYPWCKVIVIWNRHAYKYALNCSVDKIELKYGCYKFFCEKRQNGRVDKVVVIHEDFLVDFLEDYEAFMRDDENDIESGLQEETDKERTKRSIFQKARDRCFRKGVLEKYHFQCAVCRCNIPQLLEAAHERGYEACNTDHDMVEHGICLCRNHHAMYDSTTEENSQIHLMDIDLKNHTITINDKRIEKMAWYQEFLTTYGGQLLQP